MASLRLPVLKPKEQQFAAADVRTVPQHGLVRLAIIVASVLALLVDGTASAIVNAGLPYVQGITTATPDQASWIITCFNAPYYATILVSPWLYAFLGRKPLLLIGLIGFAFVSILLSLTSSYSLLLVLRFFQGLFLGAVYVPAAILLFTSLPLAALTLAIPGFALVSLGAATMGSIIGGYLSENFSGYLIYLPGAATTLISAALVYFMAPNLDKPQPHLKHDVLGYFLSLLSFGAMWYLANEGERRNWFDDPSIYVAVVVLLIAFPLLLAWELYITRYPHINFRLFQRFRNLAVGGSINFFLGMAGYSVSLFILYLQTIIAATETLAGAMILLRLAAYVVGIAIAFLLVSRKILGLRTVIIIAAIGTSISFFIYAQTMTSTAEAASFIAISLVFGFFFSMLSQPVPSLVIGGLPLEQLPAGLSIYKVTSPIGLIVATAVFQTLYDHRTAIHAADLAGFVNRKSLEISSFLEGGGSQHGLSALVLQEAQNFALRDSMMVLGVLILVVIPLIFLANIAPRPPAQNK